MLVLAGLIVVAAAAALLFLYLARQPNRQSLWRRAIAIGIGLGVVRALLASFGWYVVERTGGPFQVPAFALAMLAFPEAALTAARRTTPQPPEFFLWLSLLVVVSTSSFVAFLAIVAGKHGRS